MNPTGPDSPARTLEELTAIDADDLLALRLHLADGARELGLVDVAYRIVDTPLGRLLLAGTGEGLVRVAFDREGFDGVLEALAARISPRVLLAPARLDGPARQLDDYFAGSRHHFELRLDRRLSAGFRGTVQEYLPSIGYGHTLTYRQVAEAVGNPGAIRAVGSACATNPLPVIVPCHRVLRTDGTLGGYVGGLDAKRTLLALEHENS